MQKGFNSDITFEGIHFHVQTEDWGIANPFLVSRIYKSGAVIKSVKTPYAKVFSRGPATPELAIRQALRNQHQEILDQLISGQLTL